jgi:hypothetical protein
MSLGSKRNDILYYEFIPKKGAVTGGWINFSAEGLHNFYFATK